MLNSVLLDTHTFAWALQGDTRLSAQAAGAIDGAETVFVSAITLYEIAQKTRRGRWPEMAPYVSRLPQYVIRQGSQLLSVTDQVCLEAGLMDWQHRDPFDRILGATANLMLIPIVSNDRAFDGVVDRIW